MRGLRSIHVSPYAATVMLPMQTAIIRPTVPDANVSLRECGWPECLRADVQGDPFCLLQCMSPEVARNGHAGVSWRCPLLGEQRKTFALIELFRFRPRPCGNVFRTPITASNWVR